MDGDRSYSLLADPDQWARCSHTDTALLDGGGVQLAWDEAASPPAGPASGPGGLAFDRWCTAYRSEPGHNRVVAVPVGAAAQTVDGCDGVLARPEGLDVDCAQRLYVAEAGAGRVALVDLWSRRLLRRVPVRSRQHRDRRPVDVAARRCGAYVLLQQPVGLFIIDGRRGPRPGPQLLRPRIRTRMVASRLATGPGGAIFILWRTPDGDALVATGDGRPLVRDLDGASDLAVTPDGVLIAGGHAGPLRRFRHEGNGWLELEPLAATGFDGGAIAVSPDGRIAFTTAVGIGWTGGPQVSYRPRGRVVGYRLDAGEYRTRWGRVFIDACLPPETRAEVRFLTTDDDEVVDPVAWHRPERSTTPVHPTDLSRPLPPRKLPEISSAMPLFRRPTGRESPWAQIDADDRFETYEAPVTAGPGRYLWVVLDLTGTDRATPRVRELRVERPGHHLLHQLPGSWSRDERDADFLQRFLAPAEGIVHELDQRAARRELLLDARVAPQEALSWLAGLTGLVLDRRWSEPARRALVAQAYVLFRRRGTLDALRQILGIYLGRDPVILENWRLRGIPGAILGSTPTGPASSVLGAGMRAGGEVGTAGSTSAVLDGYRTAAHRFSVLVPLDLSTEQLEVVRSIVDQQKPAHTRYDVCELGLGMRVGRHLHLNLTSVVGPDSGWGPAVVGQIAVGGDGVIGVPAVGARLGENSTIGAVRVG